MLDMNLKKLQQLAARAGLGRRALLSAGVATALAPLLAVSAVAGLTGSDEPAPDGTSSSDTTGFTTHTNEIGCDDFLFVDGTKIAAAGGPAECEEGSSGDNRQNGAEIVTSTPEPAGTTDTTLTGAATATAAAASTTGAKDPHSDGNGCDDVNEQQPGGPQGCEVGNSAEHRKNGANKTATATGTAASSETPASDATAAATGTAATEAKDPHSDGNGCDDVNEHKPGGPQGCDVGNSAGHRKNGNNNSGTATATPEPGGTAAAATTPTSGNGNGNGNGQGNGKGKNK
jgi:hypothetical protein